MPGKMGQIRPSNAIRTPRMATAGRTWQLGFQPVQKMPTIHASSGFIRGIPVRGQSARPSFTADLEFQQTLQDGSGQ